MRNIYIFLTNVIAYKKQRTPAPRNFILYISDHKYSTFSGVINKHD